MPHFSSDQYDVEVQMHGFPTNYDVTEVVAVLAMIPNRVYGCRDAIAERAELSPAPGIAPALRS